MKERERIDELRGVKTYNQQQRIINQIYLIEWSCRATNQQFFHFLHSKEKKTFFFISANQSLLIELMEWKSIITVIIVKTSLVFNTVKMIEW